MAKSFFRRMIEEKELEHEIIIVEHNNMNHILEMEALLDIIEKSAPEEQKLIRQKMSVIDFKNGDIMHFMKHLAKSYIITNY
ncbi:MAG: hypothetical protein N2A99_04065 [Carnobacterium alterfunditum]